MAPETTISRTRQIVHVPTVVEIPPSARTAPVEGPARRHLNRFYKVAAWSIVFVLSMIVAAVPLRSDDGMALSRWVAVVIRDACLLVAVFAVVRKLNSKSLGTAALLKWFGVFALGRAAVSIVVAVVLLAGVGAASLSEAGPSQEDRRQATFRAVLDAGNEYERIQSVLMSQTGGITDDEIRAFVPFCDAAIEKGERADRAVLNAEIAGMGDAFHDRFIGGIRDLRTAAKSADRPAVLMAVVRINGYSDWSKHH